MGVCCTQSKLLNGLKGCLGSFQLQGLYAFVHAVGIVLMLAFTVLPSLPLRRGGTSKLTTYGLGSGLSCTYDTFSSLEDISEPDELL